MAFELSRLSDSGDPELPISNDELRERIIETLLNSQAQHYRRLWMYYRNPMHPRAALCDQQGSDRPYRQAQEWGLPSSVTGVRALSQEPLGPCDLVDGVARKEVVIENDIAWRIDTMVDFLFGKPISIGSLSSDPDRRAQIEAVLAQIIQHHGGDVFFQQLALLGAVYGFVDVLVKFDASQLNSQNDSHRDVDTTRASLKGSETLSVSSLLPSAESAPDDASSSDQNASHFPSHDDAISRITRCIRLEVVEPARTLPVLSEMDWREVRAYVQVYRVSRKSVQKPPEPRSGAKSGWLQRIFSQLATVRSTVGLSREQDECTTITEILTSDSWKRYQDGKLIDQGANSLGQIPLVHIQNIAVPFQYSGTSDVEQLIPLQDELNTRLSDRANRITRQSFKMYLGKGIDGFNELPVAPGRMWVTDNSAADVVEFGGEASSPSEDQHITELREAMDKTSGVTPIAAGAIRGRIGNLTSAAALRVTMMSLLAKTERKRVTYGAAIQRMCELALEWLDRAGLFNTEPQERKVEVRWQGLLPDSQIDRLREAQVKQSLGIPSDVILTELGYAAEATNTVNKV